MKLLLPFSGWVFGYLIEHFNFVQGNLIHMSDPFDLWNIAILNPTNNGLLIPFDDFREFSSRKEMAHPIFMTGWGIDVNWGIWGSRVSGCVNPSRLRRLN